MLDLSSIPFLKAAWACSSHWQISSLGLTTERVDMRYLRSAWARVPYQNDEMYEMDLSAARFAVYLNPLLAGDGSWLGLLTTPSWRLTRKSRALQDNMNGHTAQCSAGVNIPLFHRLQTPVRCVCTGVECHTRIGLVRIATRIEGCRMQLKLIRDTSGLQYASWSRRTWHRREPSRP